MNPNVGNTHQTYRPIISPVSASVFTERRGFQVEIAGCDACCISRGGQWRNRIMNNREAEVSVWWTSAKDESSNLSCPPQTKGKLSNMKHNTLIDDLNEEQLDQLIADLKSSLAAMPKDEIDWDGKRGFYEGALRKAEARLNDLRNGLSDQLLTNGDAP